MEPEPKPTTSLKDLERPIVRERYEPWDRDVPFRRLGTTALMRFAKDWGDLQQEISTDNDHWTDRQKAIVTTDFYSELLEQTCLDPVATAEQWRDDATPTTILELGIMALKISGLAVEQLEQKKTDLTDLSPDSASTSAENSEYPTPITSTDS